MKAALNKIVWPVSSPKKNGQGKRFPEVRRLVVTRSWGNQSKHSQFVELIRIPEKRLIYFWKLFNLLDVAALRDRHGWYISENGLVKKQFQSSEIG